MYDMNLKKRITLIPEEKGNLNMMAIDYHYMHRAIHDRACPFGWVIEFDGERMQSDGTPSGFIIFASIHFTKLRNEFGYPGLPTKWQVLSLARLWLHDSLPFNSETCTIAKALKQVQKQWIKVHPPRYLDEPYHILKVISFADTAYHEGTIYRAANFRETGRTISKRRHKNTRGAGMDGHELIRFVYDLHEPHWKYEPDQLDMFSDNNQFTTYEVRA